MNGSLEKDEPSNLIESCEPIWARLQCPSGTGVNITRTKWGLAGTQDTYEPSFVE